MPTLYILMPLDIPSMNPGKAMAQASHASNAFVYGNRRVIRNFGSEHNPEYGFAWSDSDSGFHPSVNSAVQDAVDVWEECTPQGFGTTIVLGVPEGTSLEHIVDEAREEGFIADVVIDPTYPIRDGRLTHIAEAITCAYVFTNSRAHNSVEALKDFYLHP